MALVNRDRVMETSTTTGTGTLTLAGAVTGYQAFSAIGDANTCYYSAWGVDANGTPTGEWEEGLGTYTLSGTTLARTTVTASSNANAAVSFSAGTKRVANVMPASGTVVVRQPGGTAGTHEGYLQQNGTSFLIGGPGNTSIMQICPSGNDRVYFATPWVSDSAFSYILRNSGDGTFGMKSAGTIGWSNTTNSYDASDTYLAKVATGVVRAGMGSLGGTGAWLQNTAGEAALAANFTKANATFGSTNLSLTVIAGRSYRIEGHLIVSNSTAGEGAQFDFNGGTATATTFDAALQAIGTNVAGTVVSAALATVLNYTSVTGTNRILVSGYFKVNAGGTLILRAAENTTATGTMTLAAGSWLALHDTVNL